MRCILWLQILCDVLRAGGYPGKVDSNLPQPPIFFAADDFEYSTQFPVPRFGMGAFRIILESLYVKLMKRPLAFTSFGKPKPIAYNLAGKTLHNIARMMHFQDRMIPSPKETSSVGRLELPEPREEDHALKTLYMIGDNPETDIAGAIGAGRPWFSILVRSGNFRGTGNHDKYSADKVVDDVYAAVDFIFKREGISAK
jgi:ribonucleotide monophosphatase NagD (HAD superfamily)